jgi:hypothetical protein
MSATEAAEGDLRAILRRQLERSLATILRRPERSVVDGAQAGLKVLVHVRSLFGELSAELLQLDRRPIDSRNSRRRGWLNG